MSELIRADLRDPTTGEKKGVKNLTSSILDEGQATQRNALDVVIRDEDGELLGDGTPPYTHGMAVIYSMTTPSMSINTPSKSGVTG